MRKENLLSRNEMRKVGTFNGDDLRWYRNDGCLSQDYMAKMLGISQSTYQRLESGDIKISLERLIKFAEILNQPVETLTQRNHITKWLSGLNNKAEIQRLQGIIIQQQERIEKLEEQLKNRKEQID